MLVISVFYRPFKAKKMLNFQSEPQRRLKNSFNERFIIGYHIALPVSKIRLKSIQNRFQYFIFPECQPDWIILGFETCGLSWTRKWKWAKSYTSKGVAGATSSWSCRNEDIGVRPFKCMRTNVWLFFPRTLSYFYSYLGFTYHSYHYYWWWRQ